MNQRFYTDKIIELLDNELQELRARNEPLTRAFFDNPEIQEQIKNQVKAIASIFKHAVPSDEHFREYYILALNEFKGNNATDILPSISLTKSKNKTWLSEERAAQIDWHYSERYFRYLKSLGRSQKIIAEARRSSLEVLKKIGDPEADNAFYIKGMVFGSVQSGKTTNFNAVINGAIDLGYPLIIVLSGIMEDLRVQTQLRVEDEVVGYGVIDVEKGNFGFKGVGEIKKFGELGDNAIKQIMIPTSQHADFNINIKRTEFAINHKNVLVCKKNSRVLANLVLWLSDQLAEGQNKHDIPFLLIDDEADNASLNNMGHKGKEYATTINGNIRALLGLFKRKTYLGYTATPFANVLQDRNETPLTKWPISYKEAGVTREKRFDLVDNLAPDDFVELLFPPSIYVGAKHFFETRLSEINKIEPLISPPVNDYHNSFPSRVFKDTEQAAKPGEKDTRASKKTDIFPRFLPESLKDAIRCFVISTALRLSRRPEMVSSKLYQPHNSMLIHISRFTLWQNRTKELVKTFVEELTTRLNTELPDGKESVYAELELTWIRHYAHIVQNIKSYLPDDYEDDFLTPKDYHKDIRSNLLTAITGIQVVAINSDNTSDALVYNKKSEKKYIAIGGNKLSRGFTLEGLTINYFIRNTDFADTLLQMGRWFGYRPGYLDCCKLFTTSANIHKFDTVSVTVEELEETFKEINKKDGRPKDFEIRVRDNPKVIKLTRNSILKNAESINVNYSMGMEQSTKFWINKNAIETAWTGFVEHIKRLKWEEDKTKDVFFHSTDAAGLFAFLELQNTFYDFDLPGVREYIELCNANGKLVSWKIGIRKNSGAREVVLLASSKSGLPGNINLTIRRGPREQASGRYDFLENNIFRVSDKSAQIITSGSDFGLTLNDDQMVEVKKKFLARREAGSATNIPDKDYRLAMNDQEGTLMIYLIDTKHVFTSPDGADKELEARAVELGIDTTIPLFGYALGFPEIKGDFGGNYVRVKQPDPITPEEGEEEEDEFPEELLEG
ncbi:Z1 domain-containing protein [Pedobacter africanus]|uniref:Z1 domain-containing protein n=1 Tax=Pedobacter africanus TaxID=151894 RepID=A0A1W2CTB8_9SPHI|nr:Z1 domain-containing protein [Pedobacter africanus]SMC88461.1 Z1 domain-containing protein [Pedobacter africanus]